MSRLYRYRLPPWCRRWLYIIEKAMLPLAIFQLLRTLLFPTTFDVFLLGIILGIFIAFHLEWI